MVEKDLAKRAVVLLMEPFLDKGYYVFMDNYYTFKGLFEELEGRSNRLDLPKDICGLKAKEVKSLKRGESLYGQKATLACVTWRDRKPVRVLGTVPTSEDDSADVLERSNGLWVKQNFTRPGLINLYDAYTGGVNVSDQKVSSYGRLMRGSVWDYIFFLSHGSVCFKCTHSGKKISKS